jgi:TRAP-type C4-dicarboxylate transport system substrate-binding protein
MLKRTLVLTAAIVAASLASSAFLAAAPPQAPMNIKLSTIAPANTSWHKALLDMGDAWTKDTGGRVKLTVYAGGVQGSEEATIRMMRPGVDTMQAGLYTSGGLSAIDESFNVMGMPFFFESDDEELAVQTKLQPVFEQRLNAKGFHLLNWGTGGWVQIFSKKPLRTLEDVKASKMYTSKGDDKMVQWFTRNGFHPVALLPSDIPAQLKLSTGLIDTTPYPPYVALASQIYRDAKYMLDAKLAPLVGATIIANTTWNKLSAADQAAMTKAAKALEARVRADGPKQDADSLTAMKARGLEVIVPDAKAQAAFRAASSSLVTSMRGDMVPADVYDQAVAARDAYRKTKK